MYVVKRLIDFVMDILETVTFVGSIFIVIYLFIMQPNQVKGASMEPTFASGDYIFTSKITYKLRPIERGDIVVFRSPKNPDIEFIKRIIALPGDRVMIRDGQVYLNEQPVMEDYVDNQTFVWEGGYSQEGVENVVGEGEIFVMGDNRSRSSDSREFGPIPITSLIGQVFYRYYPPQKAGAVKNPVPRNLRSIRPFPHFLFAFSHTLP